MLVSQLYSWTAVVLLALPNLTASLAAEPGLLRRDDPPPPPSTSANSNSATPTTTPSNTGSASATSGASTAPASTSSAHSGDADAASSSVIGSNQTISDGVVLGPSATPINGNSSLGNITNIPNIQGLPVQPEITPALAVAGALLILTGAAYTLIGIKTKWLHIFISATYLFSLCVIVLIVYVMHPPISDAIQGAYLVAAAVTGLIFGAVAVIFSDVTEGLGCFLGGFCLGMWFLTLKSNGLIDSQAGKSIFLGCFTVAAFGLYISHYTRPYALIGATSFAGATAVCLGVDMFSRAGLKEFWLYIWDLNSGVFPLNYNGPYPITRGMRVEIACIILLCLLGVMSQMKVWNIVKQRREEKVAAQKHRDELRDQAEEALGRRVEDDNAHDRAIWDAVYGKDKSSETTVAGTSQASTRKGSISVASSREAGGMEMQSLPSASSSVRKGVVTVHVAEDDIAAMPSPADAKSIRSKTVQSREPSIHESQIGEAQPMVEEPAVPPKAKTTSKISPIDSKLTLKPRYVPLPFRVPGTAQEDEDDKSSVATFAESAHGIERSASRSKRVSGSNLMRKLSGRSRRSSVVPTVSQEALVGAHEDDRASSVAGTLDRASLNSISQDKLPSADTSPKLESEGFSPPESIADQGHQNAPASQVQPIVSAAKSKAHPHGALPIKQENSNSLGQEESKVRTAVTVGSEAEPKLVPTNLAGNLPEAASKVVMAYRTNEWAKHLDGAETPIWEDIVVSKRSATPTQEAAAPVNLRDLQQTALTAEPAPIKIPVQSNHEQAKVRSPKSPTDSKNPFSRSSPRISPSTSNTNLAQAIPRSPSQTSLSSTNSNEALRPALPRARASSSSLNRGLRSSSTPLISSPLAEPIDENAETSFPPRFTPSPMHLLSQRENTVQSRPSSTSLLNRSSSGPTRSFSASPSLVNIYETIDADDDIPLAQRRSFLQQQQSQTTLLSPQRSQTTSGTSTPLNLSRNPSRLSLAQVKPQQSASYNPTPGLTQRDSTISSWRQSLATDKAHQNAAETAEIEAKRFEMMQEKQAGRNSRAIERMQEQARKSVIDKEMMRRGSGMMDAHREAMRRMQSGVNEKLRNGS